MTALLKAAVSALVAVFFGICLLIVNGLPLKWLISFVGFSGLACLAVLSRSPERLALTILFMTFPIPVANFIGQLSAAHRGGAPGYFTILSDIPLVVLYALWLPRLLSRSAPSIRFSPAIGCLIGIIGMSILSMWNAVDVRFSHYELMRLLIILLLYVYLANAPAVPCYLNTILTAIMIGLLIATIKVSFVALLFMHLSHERGLIYKVLLFTVIFSAAMMFLFVLAYLDPIRAALAR